MPIRVLICDDHAVLRSGLRALLGLQPDLQVVGEAGDAAGAVASVRERRPDVVLMDLAMPGGGGIEATRQVRAAWPEAKVLVLSQYDDEGYLEQALAAGAAGYALKRAADSELLAAIRTVAGGEVYLHPSLARVLVHRLVGSGPGTHAATCGQSAQLHDRPGPLSPPSALSERETQVLRLLAQGHTNQQVADRLALSVKTVEAYKARLCDKLGVRSRAALFRYAYEHGLLDE